MSQRILDPTRLVVARGSSCLQSGPIKFSLDYVPSGPSYAATKATVDNVMLSDNTYTGDNTFSGDNTFTGDTVVGNLVVSSISLGNPESCGAVGDGIVDDTTALVTCLATYGTVVFGNNRHYRVTSYLTAKSNQVIDLNGSTIGSDYSVPATANWDGQVLANYLDMNAASGTYGCFTVPMANPGYFGNYMPIISIPDHVHNVTIKNGNLTQFPTGVRVGHGAYDIFLDNVHGSYLGCYLYVAGTTGDHVVNLAVSNCRCANVRYAILNANYTDNMLIENCRFSNCGGVAMYATYLNQFVMDNVNWTFDKTYDSWPGGSNAGHLMYNWNTGNSVAPAWSFATGTNVSTYYGYLYYFVNTHWRNVNFSSLSAGNTPASAWPLNTYPQASNFIALKMCQGFGPNFTADTCKIEAAWLYVPNTATVTPGEYKQDVNFTNCEIGSVNIFPFSQEATSGCEMYSKFIGCTIGMIHICSNTGWMKYTDQMMLNCIISPYLWGFSSADSDYIGNYNVAPGAGTYPYLTGLITWKNCSFYGSPNTYTYVLKNGSGTSVNFPYADILYDSCNFIGNATGGSSYYGMRVMMATPLAPSTWKSFTIRNCKFINNRGIQNWVTNLVVSGCYFTNGISSAEAGSYMYLRNCSFDAAKPAASTQIIYSGFDDIITTNAPVFRTASAYLATTGGTATALDYFEEYAISVPVVGCSAPVTMTGTLSRIGKMCTLQWATFSGTFDTATFLYVATADIPLRFRPSGTVQKLTTVINNNVDVMGTVVVGVVGSGMVSFYVGAGTTGFYTATTIGAQSGSVSWLATV